MLWAVFLLFSYVCQLYIGAVVSLKLWSCGGEWKLFSVVTALAFIVSGEMCVSYAVGFHG